MVVEKKKRTIGPDIDRLDLIVWYFSSILKERFILVFQNPDFTSNCRKITLRRGIRT